MWKQIGKPEASPPSCQAVTASGEPLSIASEFWCDVTITGISKRGLYRVPEINLSVLGSDWMDKFGLWDVPINSFCNQVSIRTPSDVASLQAKFPEIFTNKMGLCGKTKVKLQLQGNPTPVFRPKRPVSCSMEGVVEEEIQRLHSLGVLKPVDFLDWAAPIVVVWKPNGRVRICADFSTGLNDVLECRDVGMYFSHIDLSDAYLQVEVDEKCQNLLTINTHKGLYQFTRLSPGIKSAPGAFQQLVDAMLAGLKFTCGYLDDVLLGNRTEEEHNRNLERPMSRLQEYGFTRCESCVKAGAKWDWNTACQNSVDRFKELLMSPLMLTHYNPKLDTVVSADASSIGIGARIAHRLPDDTIKAISNASRSLTSAEENYSQIEKEGLALIFAVTRFHRMLFGRHFTLETDHKPTENAAIPPTVQRIGRKKMEQSKQDSQYNLKQGAKTIYYNPQDLV
ncbi:uncharacterized protein K02A2.6-like [Aedes albopictus]|uniref:Reverse transcriptase domain-containing protein n=1 Tax=Aedes albopictus TaxID=7160 RepID=A0ABM1ZTB4_AEDAL